MMRDVRKICNSSFFKNVKRHDGSKKSIFVYYLKAITNEELKLGM